MYEPPMLEIILTNIIGNTVLRRYYKNLVEEMGLLPGDRVLDFCCGSGFISREIAKKLDNGNLVCADVSRKWLENAAEKVSSYAAETIHLENLQARGLSSEKFDKALIHFTLHDFGPMDRPEVLRLIKANMKPAGMIQIREPLSEKHGIRLHELINLLELLKLKNYNYSQRASRLIGEYIDVRINC